MPLTEKLAERPTRQPGSSLALETRLIHGRDAILAMQPQLVALSERCCQAGAMDFLAYFLTTPQARRRKPVLVLVGPGINAGELDADRILGALLVERYCVFGMPVPILATADSSGRRTVLSPPRSRALVAALGAQALMQAGAHILIVCFRADSTPEPQVEVPASALLPGRWRYALRYRRVRSHLPLLPTFDETLATVGQRTRSNMRYYRRRTEKELGCRFVPEVRLTEVEFHSFNALCTYPAPYEIAHWRYGTVHHHPAGFFLCGMQDSQGDWLALAAGRRFHGTTEIDWQMNRAAFPHLSLSAVLRAYLLEHEIARGTTRLSIEGGTPHAIRFSFAVGTVTDLILLRQSWFVALLRRFANRVLPAKESFLKQILSSEKAEWKPWT